MAKKKKESKKSQKEKSDSEGISIEFNSAIYKREAIKKAADDFKDVADISISKKQDMIIAKISKPDPEVKDIKGEFCNYVLEVMMN
jgi:hypothetical protein